MILSYIMFVYIDVESNDATANFCNSPMKYPIHR